MAAMDDNDVNGSYQTDGENGSPAQMRYPSNVTSDNENHVIASPAVCAEASAPLCFTDDYGLLATEEMVG